MRSFETTEHAEQMTEAVLFDNDGVLVDTETLFFETTRLAFAQSGLDLSRATWATRYLAEGKSSRDIALSLGADADRIPKVIEDRNRRYRQVLKRPPPLRQQVRATLKELHGRIKIAIVTGCGRDLLDLVHGASDLLNFFDLNWVVSRFVQD